MDMRAPACRQRLHGNGSATSGHGIAATLQSRSARRDMDNRNGQSETTQRTLLSDGPHRAVPRSACVVVIHGAGLGGRADVDTARVLVGRSQEADLFSSPKSALREPCQSRPVGDEYPILNHHWMSNGW